MAEETETSASKTTEETESPSSSSQQLPNPSEEPPASSSANGPPAGNLTPIITAGPMLNPYLPPGVVPYYRQVAPSPVALPSNSTTTAVGTTPPTTAALHPPPPHPHASPTATATTFPGNLAAMPIFPPHYNPYSFMQNQHTYQQQYHAAAVAFNPHAAPYGPAGGIQVGMIPSYGIGYPYGLVDPLRRPAFPPVPTTSVPPVTSSAAEKKKHAGAEDASSSQPKTIPGLASLTSPSYYPSPPDINESRRNGAGRKITPVTRDVPEDLADQRPDDLYEEVDVLDSSVTVVDSASGDSVNIADPGSYPWATTVAGPSTFHGVPLTTKFRCKICDHIFPKKHTVVTHIKTHLGKKSYPCTFAGCTMAFVREHDRKRHQATHTGERSHICECGKQFSRQDALRRHAQYGRCPNRGPVPSQLANVKVDIFAPSVGDDKTLLQQADEDTLASELGTGVAMDVTADGEDQAAPTNNEEEDQLAGDDGAAQGSKPSAKSRPRRSTAPKKESAEPAAPKVKGTKKKRKRSSFARPVDDGDSELDEDDEDGIVVQPPPPPAPARKTKKQRKSPQPKATPPVPARADSPEEEDELIDSYEEEDPNHAPSSFQFALPGVHSKEQIKASQSKKRVQPRRGRGAGASIETEIPVVVETPVTESQSHTEEAYDQVSIQPPSFASTSTDTDINSGDKYASIIERMNRTPFGIEAEVMKTTFPLGLVRNVGGQPAPSEALQRQQADQDVTMSDWVQDQDSDADMSDENGGGAKKAAESAPTTQAVVATALKEPSKGIAAVGEESSEPESDGPEEEDVAAVLGVEKASPVKETPPTVAAS
ncbi:hypothetical protein M407DRAFT_17585 [Tulasnella calospora MUT 4182]|uniref:C2H2-type domain-containing protein n=1 Tax=Tulasnella calospora MUT 4182 TaxID=1051891 RepID=A0A0C3QX80_9AGAM|nr:hypothetical protein M407DRAFT_17585 [Tulasnella calospora MUT 4182]